MMEQIVAQSLPEIKQLMLHYGVERAYLFGSAATGTMHEDSDIDFIIKFPDTMHYTTYADNYFALAKALESLLKRSVDLVTEKTLKNPYLLQVINRHKLQLIPE
jgi:uncharacterized protein